jgi:hypothetical protein
MLPACRTEGEGFALPTFDVVPSDVEGFMDELQEFQSAFHDCFPRSEPRAHFFDYMVGQFSKLERKSIEPMALQVEGGTIRGLQRFISDGVWDEEQMVWNYHQLVAEEMGAPDGVLMFDETGFVKKGQDSVGVARQYCGTLGKVENCQVGVFAAYASRHGYALVDKRLFLPEVWFADAYAARRTKCQVPDELRWQSKPQLAATMLQTMAQEGLLPFKYVVADCLYGNSPAFLDAVDACVGVTTFVAIPADTRCWLQAPRTAEQVYRYKGGSALEAGGGCPRQRPVHCGGLGGASACLSLVSAAGLGRDQGADRVRVCPPTRDALQGRLAGVYRLARDQTHHGGGANLFLLHQQCPREHVLTHLCLVKWSALGDRAMLRRRENGTWDGPL